jgi:hypothetical protein
MNVDLSIWFQGVRFDRTFEGKIVEVTYPSIRVQRPAKWIKKQVTWTIHIENSRGPLRAPPLWNLPIDLL